MIPRRALVDALDAAKHHAEILDKNLTFQDNFNAVESVVEDTGLADTEFTVTHALGKVPNYFIANTDKAGVVYETRRDEWNELEMYLKCSVDNAKVRLLIV